MDFDFIRHDLGYVTKGSTVEVTLEGNAANVRLLDNINLAKYRQGLSYSYTGGLCKQSPVYLTIPQTGTWHIVVDFQNLAGQCRSSACIIQ